MKPPLNTILLLCVTLCRANIGLAASPPIASDKSPVLSVDMGTGCAISVIDYYGGHLASGMLANASYWTEKSPVPTAIEKFSIRFECMAVQRQDGIAKQYGAAWDEDRKRWKLYFENDGEQRLIAPVSRIYQLRSKNATGFLKTTDQINGEENQRVRFYGFCLFRADKAVCGEGQSMKLAEPKGDYLPYILRVLRSVSFVDSQSSRGVRD